MWQLLLYSFNSHILKFLQCMYDIDIGTEMLILYLYIIMFQSYMLIFIHWIPSQCYIFRYSQANLSYFMLVKMPQSFTLFWRSLLMKRVIVLVCSNGRRSQGQHKALPWSCRILIGLVYNYIDVSDMMRVFSMTVSDYLRMCPIFFRLWWKFKGFTHLLWTSVMTYPLLNPSCEYRFYNHTIALKQNAQLNWEHPASCILT